MQTLRPQQQQQQQQETFLEMKAIRRKDPWRDKRKATYHKHEEETNVIGLCQGAIAVTEPKVHILS